MQNTGQLLSNHTQEISKLKVQMSQLASSLSERLKGTLPNQLLIYRKNLVKHIWLKISSWISVLWFIHWGQGNKLTTICTITYRNHYGTNHHSKQASLWSPLIWTYRWMNTYIPTLPNNTNNIKSGSPFPFQNIFHYKLSLLCPFNYMVTSNKSNTRSITCLCSLF